MHSFNLIKLLPINRSATIFPHKMWVSNLTWTHLHWRYQSLLHYKNLEDYHVIKVIKTQHPHGLQHANKTWLISFPLSFIVVFGYNLHMTAPTGTQGLLSCSCVSEYVLIGCFDIFLTNWRQMLFLQHLFWISYFQFFYKCTNFITQILI